MVRKKAAKKSKSATKAAGKKKGAKKAGASRARPTAKRAAAKRKSPLRTKARASRPARKAQPTPEVVESLITPPPAVNTPTAQPQTTVVAADEPLDTTAGM